MRQNITLKALANNDILSKPFFIRSVIFLKVVERVMEVVADEMCRWCGYWFSYRQECGC